MNERFLHVIWCDDVRQEVGNKPSFMGVYTAGINVPALPVMLDRLALYVWAYTPKERPYKDVTLSVQRDDGTVFATISTSPVDDGDLISPRDDRPDATKQVMMVGVGLAGVQIAKESKYLTVKLESDGETVEGPRLWIETPAQAVQVQQPH